MTDQEMRDFEEVWQRLQDLPKRHAQEIFNAEDEWYTKQDKCDHVLPNGVCAMYSGYCQICRRYIETTL